MKSYASIDRIEGEYAVCEVELVDVDTSKTLFAKDKKTDMVEFSMKAINNCVGEICEGDILIVEQEKGTIIVIYGKDLEEKQRRIKLIKSIMGK